MLTYLAFLVVVLVAISSCEECGKNCNDDSQRPGLYICRGISGEEMSIPCGPYFENDGITRFTYVNQTTGSILLLNSTEPCLRVTELTPYDDHQTIACEPSTLQNGAAYRYQLLVEYSPSIFNYKPNQASFHNYYLLKCPLEANPSPVCTWSYHWCDTGESISERALYESAGTSGEGNCTLFIREFNTTHISICYECVASNYLGTANVSLSIPLNETSICQAKKYIVVLPKPIIEVNEGSNLTLSCKIFGILNTQKEYWDFESDDGHQETYESDNHQNDFETCTQTGDLTLSKVSVNQSGNYTCVYSSDLKSSIQVKVKGFSIDSSEDGNEPNVVAIVVGSSASLVVLLLSLVGTAIFLIRYKLRGSSGRQFTYLYQTDYDGEEDYDVFLSFAEEDKFAAEFSIKEPLEKCGYSVCWHHDAFLPGHTIEDNMERSIFRSKCTIALISEAFLASQFCLTELNLTKRKMHETSKNCLVPVLVDEKCSVPSDILSITYVSIGDAALIDRLKSRIGKPL